MSMQGISSDMLQTMQRINAIDARLRQITGDNTTAPQGTTPAASSFAGMVESSDVTAPTAIPATATADDVSTIIAQASEQYHLRPELLRAVIQTESGFNANAVSPAGAQGMMQLMPSTATALGVTNPFDPRQNIMAGAQYLSEQLARFGGDERKALAAYNAGPGAVLRYGGVPPYPETTHYVTKILSLAGPAHGEE